MTERKKLALFGLIAASFALTSPAPAQEIKLTFADQGSPAGWGPSHALKPWLQQVEEATKGRVKFELFPSQTLLKGPDMWKGVRDGVADMAWCVQGYWPGQTPLSEVMSLPFLPITTAEQGSEVYWKLYEKFPSMQKEFGDILPLVLHTSSSNMIVAKKPVKTLEDLKGLKLRMLAGPPTEMLKTLGAEPASIPMPEVYQAIDKGMVDGTGAPWEAVHGYRLYEVAKYFTEAPFYGSAFSVCANRQKIESLPKDVRDQIMSVGGLAGAKFWGKNFFDTAEQGALERAKAGSFEINRYKISPEEVARWRKIAGEPLWEAWVTKMEAKGLTDARAILATALDLLKN
jgi:TRAP-type C4-dicarboxylate transport system substrate-binding protein